MSINLITKLQDERAQAVAFIEELTSSVEGRDLVDAELDNLRSSRERIEAIDAQLAPLIEFAERASAAKQFDGRIRVQDRAQHAPAAEAGPIDLGAEFISSEQYPGGGAGFRGTSARLTRDLPLGEFRATLLTTTSQGEKYLPKTGRTWQDIASGTPLPLLDLLNPEPTDLTSGEVVVIGEATGATVVAEGADKPEVEWVETVAPWSLETVAGWKKFSRQMLEDGPAVQALINGKLLQAVRKRLHANAVTVMNAAFSGANSTTGAAGVQLYKLVRNAIATLQDRDVYPNFVALNPADHAAMDLDILGLTLQGPVVQSGYWGLQVIALSGVPAGSAYVGDLTEAITWKQKGAVDLYITDSDISGAGNTAKSDFRTNTLTALMETRAKFIVSDASALQKVTRTP